MLNALSSRPDDRSAERHLAEAVAMRVPRGASLVDEASFTSLDEPTFDPINDRLGTFFLSDIVRNQHGLWWRVPTNHVSDVRTLLLLYRSRTLTDLEITVGAAAERSTRRGPVNPARVHNRRPMTLPIELINPEAVVELGLDLEDVALRPAVIVAGPDTELLEDQETNFYDDEDSLFRREGIAVDDIVDIIVAQWGFDLMQVTPNIKSSLEPAHTILDQTQLTKVTRSLYESSVLPFRHAWIRPGSVVDFETVCRRLFPSPSTTSALNGPPQNYNSCRYFRLWDRLTQKASAEDIEKIWRKIYNLVMRSTQWLPYALTDRIWRSSVTKPGAWVFLGSDSEGPGAGVAAPHIIINMHLVHSIFDVRLGNPFFVEVPQEDLQARAQADVERRHERRARRRLRDYRNREVTGGARVPRSSEAPEGSAPPLGPLDVPQARDVSRRPTSFESSDDEEHGDDPVPRREPRAIPMEEEETSDSEPPSPVALEDHSLQEGIRYQPPEDMDDRIRELYDHLRSVGGVLDVHQEDNSEEAGSVRHSLSSASPPLSPRHASPPWAVDFGPAYDDPDYQYGVSYANSPRAVSPHHPNPTPPAMDLDIEQSVQGAENDPVDDDSDDDIAFAAKLNLDDVMPRSVMRSSKSTSLAPAGSLSRAQSTSALFAYATLPNVLIIPAIPAIERSASYESSVPSTRSLTPCEYDADGENPFLLPTTSSVPVASRDVTPSLYDVDGENPFLVSFDNLQVSEAQDVTSNSLYNSNNSHNAQPHRRTLRGALFPLHPSPTPSRSTRPSRPSPLRL